MAYMMILTQTDRYLKLIRKPTQLSQLIMVGMLVGVFGVIFFGTTETFVTKAAIGLGAVLLSFYMVENYEICELDLEADEARLSHLHWSQYLLGHVMPGAWKPHALVVKLSDIKSADVEAQDSGKTAHQVTLTLYSGVSLGITEIFTSEPIEDHEAIALKIKTFLKFSDKTEGHAGESAAKDDNNGLSSDDENSQDDVDSEFETISKADIEGFQEENEIVKGNDGEDQLKENETDIKTEVNPTQ